MISGICRALTRSSWSDCISLVVIGSCATRVFWHCMRQQQHPEPTAPLTCVGEASSGPMVAAVATEALLGAAYIAPGSRQSWCHKSPHHKEIVLCRAVNGTVMVADKDQMQVLDIKTGRLLKEIPIAPPVDLNYSSDIAFSSDGNTCVIRPRSIVRKTQVVDVATMTMRAELSPNMERVTMSRNGTTCIERSYGQVKVWDLETLDCQEFRLEGPGNSHVCANGTMLLYYATPGLMAMDLTTGAHRCIVSGPLRSWSTPSTLCTSAAGNVVAIRRPGSSTLELWTTGASSPPKAGPPNVDAMDIALSPNGAFLGYYEPSRTMMLWDVQAGAYRQLERPLEDIQKFVFSPNSCILCAYSDKEVRVWDIASGKCLLSAPLDSTLRSVNISPDSQHIVVQLQQEVIVFSIG